MKDLGWLNGWYENPPAEVVKCRELKHQTTDVDVGPPHRGTDHVITCSLCQIVYHIDSSD